MALFWPAAFIYMVTTYAVIAYVCFLAIDVLIADPVIVGRLIRELMGRASEDVQCTDWILQDILHWIQWVFA